MRCNDPRSVRRITVIREQKAADAQAYKTKVAAEAAYVAATKDAEALLVRQAKEAEGLLIRQAKEAEGLSIIVEREQAERARLPWMLEVRMITLTVHSDLEAVGFIARISAVLAKAHIPCNVVSACFHAYIFVPCELASTALYLLIALTGTANTLPST